MKKILIAPFVDITKRLVNAIQKYHILAVNFVNFSIITSQGKELLISGLTITLNRVIISIRIYSKYYCTWTSL